MDPSAALLRPRLRLRRTPSPAVPDTDDATPQPPPRPLHDDDDAPTPRVFPKPINADSAFHTPAETPAARLRALLAREPRSPRDLTPAPPSEADSAEPSRFGSSTSSVARESLKDIFSRALREPGDTPQRGRQRRNSDGSSMEITPVVTRDRGPRRAARRSLSDEEAEKPKSSRQSDRSFRLSTAVTFDTLRARLTASQSQLLDQNLPEALNDPSSSTSYVQHHPQATSRVAPSLSTLTPHPSFQMTSQLALQSNLLEQDSEMQRAMGDVLNSETEASTSAAHIGQSTAIPSESLRGQRRTDYELDSSTSTSSVNEKEHHSNEEERDHQPEQERSRQRPPSWSGTPEVHRRHSQDFHRRRSQEFRTPSLRQLEKRSSLVSLRSFDDDHSSRPSSIGSQADYRDRISELERERNHEREREWNRRHPPSRPSSSLSTSSNHSFSHSHSHPPRSPSATPYLAPTHASLRRTSSRTSLRSDSPASLASSRDSLNEREKEEKEEIKHERERNWNSPRPHWSSSKSPSSSGLRSRNNSLRSSLSRLEGSHGHPGPTHTSPKVGSSPVSSPVSHEPGDRPDERVIGSTLATPLNGYSPGKSTGATSKFGWNLARSPLPPLELDDRHNSTSPRGSPPPSRTSGVVISSQIPIRSKTKFSTPGHMTSNMSFTHVVGDESSVQHRPNEIVETPSRRVHATTGNSWDREDMVLASDEESVNDLPPQSTTPKSNPPNPIPEEIDTDVDTEILTSPSQQGSPRFGTFDPTPSEASLQRVDGPPRSQSPDRFLEEPSVGGTPPGTPPSAATESRQPTIEVSYSLLTPPRRSSFSNSVLDFRTPSPPHDLPDLPGPPSSDDDALGSTLAKDLHINANPNSTISKTPKPPGAWAATPLPSKFGHQPSSTPFPLESTPPAFTSTPLPRVYSLPPASIETEADHPAEHELLTPVATLSRARSLPLRTPALPGAWMATPGQSALLGNGVDQSQYGSLGKKKGLLKVRFDVAESETSATEGHPSSPLSAIRLTNPELPMSNRTVDHATDGSGPVVKQTPVTPAPPLRPATPERSTTPTSRESGPSPRSLRRSPAIRLVDAFGRERVDKEGAAVLSIDLPNGHADHERKTTTSPSTPRRSLVRIVDAMGRDVDDTMEMSDAPKDRTNRSFGADFSLVSDDNPLGHAEALARMRQSLKDLAESLSDADRSEDLELNSSHLEQLEEVSQAARLARNKLAHNLRLETSKEHDLRGNNNISAWTRGLLRVATKNSWNVALIYWGVIMQLLLVLIMWRYANAEARRLFYTTYYDPLYPEFTPLRGNSCFSGMLSTSRSWTLLDSFEIIDREGWWSIGPEILRAMRHVGSRAWEQWGEHAHFEKPT